MGSGDSYTEETGYSILSEMFASLKPMDPNCPNPTLILSL